MSVQSRPPCCFTVLGLQISAGDAGSLQLQPCLNHNSFYPCFEAFKLSSEFNEAKLEHLGRVSKHRANIKQHPSGLLQSKLQILHQ